MKHITTYIFDNLQIDGKVSNNTLLIGSGIDEVIKLQVGKTDGTNPAIRYVPSDGTTTSHLEYTNDGVTWKQFDGGSSSGVTYVPILFDSSHLTSGKVTILHNLGHLPLCLDYTPKPQDVTISNTQIILDYGDQSNGTEATTFSGACWFIDSAQDMLSPGKSA